MSIIGFYKELCFINVWGYMDLLRKVVFKLDRKRKYNEKVLGLKCRFFFCFIIVVMKCKLEDVLMYF